MASRWAKDSIQPLASDGSYTKDNIPGIQNTHNLDFSPCSHSFTNRLSTYTVSGMGSDVGDNAFHAQAGTSILALRVVRVQGTMNGPMWRKYESDIEGNMVLKLASGMCPHVGLSAWSSQPVTSARARPRPPAQSQSQALCIVHPDPWLCPNICGPWP